MTELEIQIYRQSKTVIQKLEQNLRESIRVNEDFSSEQDQKFNEEILKTFVIRKIHIETKGHPFICLPDKTPETILISGHVSHNGNIIPCPGLPPKVSIEIKLENSKTFSKNVESKDFMIVHYFSKRVKAEWFSDFTVQREKMAVSQLYRIPILDIRNPEILEQYGNGWTNNPFLNKLHMEALKNLSTNF